MKSLLVSISLASLLLANSTLANGVYKTVDENGRITYSDTPTGKKIDPVDLPQVNTQPAVTPQPYLPQPTQSEQAPAQYRVSITSPANETQLLPGQRDLSVAAEVSPQLGEGYSAQLYMNGQPYGGAQPSSSFVISNIYRGEHRLSVAILNPSGRVIARSPTITVYVIRPSAR